MSKFKVGDRVRYTGYHPFIGTVVPSGPEASNYLWVRPDDPCPKHWAGALTRGCFVGGENFELLHADDQLQFLVTGADYEQIFETEDEAREQATKMAKRDLNAQINIYRAALITTLQAKVVVEVVP